MLLPAFMIKIFAFIFANLRIPLVITSFWWEWIGNNCYKGKWKLIEQHEKSLANYRGDTFSFYLKNIDPSEIQALLWNISSLYSSCSRHMYKLVA